MEYTVGQLVEEVKVAIDENVDSTKLEVLEDADTLTLNGIIRSKVEDAARLVIEAADHRLLEGGVSLVGVAFSWKGSPVGAGYIDLPAESPYLRLVVFQMSDWPYGVTDSISEEDDAYLLQTSRWGGIRGNNERPVVAVVRREEGYRLEWWGSLNGDATVLRGSYIPVPAVKDGKIDLCPKLHRATVYRLASMACAITGASDLAAILLGESNRLAGAVDR